MYAYSDNGLTKRAYDAGAPLQAGEVSFPGIATPAQLAAVFSGYAEAVAAQSATTAYSVAINAGCQVVSTGTPGLNGVYGIAPPNISDIQAQQVSILTRGTFTNGQTSRAWIDSAGGVHAFATPAEFTDFAEAIGQYVDALAMALATAQAGGTWNPPSQPVTFP